MLGLYKMLEGFEDKTAYAQTICSYMAEGLEEPLLFIGRTNVVTSFSVAKLKLITPSYIRERLWHHEENRDFPGIRFFNLMATKKRKQKYF